MKQKKALCCCLAVGSSNALLVGRLVSPFGPRLRTTSLHHGRLPLGRLRNAYASLSLPQKLMTGSRRHGGHEWPPDVVWFNQAPGCHENHPIDGSILSLSKLGNSAPLAAEPTIAGRVSESNWKSRQSKLLTRAIERHNHGRRSGDCISGTFAATP